ncbi:MAG: amidohydrolase family protein [Candidatus Marinimicrobia bacterium]|nr:amidohydrolase family protein [Candidatus Neomarinimicrobiota bacterium]
MHDHFILTNGIVTDGFSFLIENCRIEIADGKIANIGDASDFKSKDIKIIDLKGRLVLPGLLNPHHHLYSALATGLVPIGPTDNFTQILENLWWQLDKTLDEESIYYSAVSGLMQSVRYGVTTLFDHHASMSRVTGSLQLIEKAFRKIGVKGVLCYEISDRMGKNFLQSQINENINFYIKNMEDPQIQGLLGLHANFTLSEASMATIAEQKPEELPIHIHCGEDKADFDYCVEQGYNGPVHRLFEYGLLSENSILAHCIHLSETDYQLLQKFEPIIISNPESNANNNVGLMNIEKIENYLLGTDGMTGNILGTLRSHYLQRNGNLPNAMKILFENPAQLTGRYFSNSGTIREGNAADFAITNYIPVMPINLDNLLYHLLFGVQGKEMFMTIADGKILFSDNTLHTIDETEINKEIKKVVNKLHERFYE